MKLQLFSFDFEECTLSFSVPKEIMHSRSFGNVPGGVEVDLGAITNDATLGIKELPNTAANTGSPKLVEPLQRVFSLLKQGEYLIAEIELSNVLNQLRAGA